MDMGIVNAGNLPLYTLDIFSSSLELSPLTETYNIHMGILRKTLYHLHLVTWTKNY